MKKIILLFAIAVLTACAAKKPKSHGFNFESGTSIANLTNTSDTIAFSSQYTNPFPTYTHAWVSYLMVVGHVTMGPNSYLVIIKDSTKLSIKYADSLFILHISPKFVKKINDSTFTFKNQK